MMQGRSGSSDFTTLIKCMIFFKVDMQYPFYDSKVIKKGIR